MKKRQLFLQNFAVKRLQWNGSCGSELVKLLSTPDTTLPSSPVSCGSRLPARWELRLLSAPLAAFGPLGAVLVDELVSSCRRLCESWKSSECCTLPPVGNSHSLCYGSLLSFSPRPLPLRREGEVVEGGSQSFSAICSCMAWGWWPSLSGP